MSKPRPTNTKLLSHARDMRSNPSLAEAKLWAALRAGRLNGTKWRRQVVVAGYIVDFLCNDTRLVIELDGESHDGIRAYDDHRTRVLANEGLRVVRLSNEQVLFQFEAVLRTIVLEYEESIANMTSTRPLP